MTKSSEYNAKITGNSKSLFVFFRAFWPPLPVWKRLDAAVFAVAGYTALVVFVVTMTNITLPEWSGGSAILNAVILGLLLGFRNQEAYSRWWEARNLWGKLINDSRTLMAKIASMTNLSQQARFQTLAVVPSFAKALKQLLRDESTPQQTAILKGRHAPLYFFAKYLETLHQERAADRLSHYDMLLLDPHIRGLMDVCGGCERIKNTPLPRSYRALLRHGLLLYLLSAPWLVADHLTWWAVPMMALLSYFLLGIELTAEDVEEPFGRAADDLTLTAYCDTIDKAAEQLFADRKPSVE